MNKKKFKVPHEQEQHITTGKKKENVIHKRKHFPLYWHIKKRKEK